MALSNDYLTKKWADPGKDSITGKTRPSNTRTRATYFEGLMALYRIKPDQKYLDYMIDWGESHKWGLAYSNENRNADVMCCGQT